MVFKDGEFEWYNPKQVDTREPLTQSEELYFNLIKRHANHGSIKMSDLQERIFYDTDYTHSFSKNIKKSVLDIGFALKYFQKNNYLKIRNKMRRTSSSRLKWGIILLIVCNISRRSFVELAFGGLPLLTITNILSAIYLYIMSKKHVVLTELGEEEYKKWRGLYNFLNSDTLINEKSVIELPLWEKYLVYATAFGISEKVIAAIKIHCNEIRVSGTTVRSGYSSGHSSIVYNSYCRSGRIRTYGSNFRSSVRGSSMIYNGSSGYSSLGFGGYGGGRGGGSGGGGH